METMLIREYQDSDVGDFVKRVKELGLTRYASEAVNEMKFEDITEFYEAVRRAMKLCVQAGFTMEENFIQIYKCSVDGIIYDWKISPLAYHLVCMNGKTSNPNVARLQIQLINKQFLNTNYKTI